MKTERSLTSYATEDDLLTAITDALSFLGYRWQHPRRSDKSVLMGDPGLPDIIAARRGVLWMIELKSDKGRLSEAQWAWKHELPLDDYHFRYRLWAPADLDAALEELTYG